MRAWVLCVLSACGDNIRVDPPALTHYELGTCGVVDVLPLEPGLHMPNGSELTWNSNPPASGSHYGIWPAYDREYTNLARGFWLHGAEHGAIVFLHRCETCVDDLAPMRDTIRAMAVDPKCVAPIQHRAIMTSDPLLPDGIELAAVAWGVVYSATCLDPDALATFAGDYYARAPEDTCANGAALGGTPL